jgi:predicted nucleic acid-binding protein
VTHYLVDNSVLQRLPHSPPVRDAVTRILNSQHELCCCALTLDEFGYSTRSAAEHAEAMRRLRGSFLYLPSSPQSDQISLDIRAALWQAGKGRAAGVIDVAIAAIATQAAAAVLHYDSDFDHIAEAYPAFSAQWIVPRGSVP